MGNGDLPGPPSLSMLLVEDQAVDQILIRRGLEHAGVELELDMVRSAEAALRRLAVGPHGSHPQVILLDLGLPGADGLDFLARLRADAALCHIPVVILSGALNKAVTRHAYQVGAAAVFEKPANLYNLQALVASIATTYSRAAA